jgi:CRISPR-associated protein Cmr2
MPHLLQIHIGPVQEFIAAARRSRDLWYGSWLLSELAKAAAREIVAREADGITALVFPAPGKLSDLTQGSTLNVANRIVATVQGPPVEIAEAARTAVNVCLTDLRDGSIRPAMQEKLHTWALAQEQISDFVEFYWVAVPLTGNDRDDRKLADHLLAARKNTRNFNAAAGRPWPKSSLDGTRESVIPKEMLDDADAMYKYFRAKPKERLSGVDLLKRLGKAGGQEHFPSTSHIAAMPLENQLQDLLNGDKAAQGRQTWQKYLVELPPSAREQERTYAGLTLPLLDDYDGSLLFASRLTDHMDRSAIGPVEEALAAFYDASGIDRPSPYYAVLAGDGDFMGRTINDMESLAENRKFSEVLATFAEQARDIVARRRGAPIFTGGDDVLALLPLHGALQCAAELADKFNTLMANDAVGGQKPPTFSAGIAIVHHLEPLEDALNLARKAEKKAKQFPDKADPQKNALGVTLAKRSGVPRSVVGHWGTIDGRLLALAALHQKGLIPDGLAYQLHGMYQELGGEDSVQDSAALQEIVRLEAERIISRKREESGAQPMDAGHRTYLLEVIAASHNTAVSIADELIIAALIADVCKLARIDLPFEPAPQGGMT